MVMLIIIEIDFNAERSSFYMYIQSNHIS